ncbi:hypothetical protein N0V84_011756 [Fusarium piperis]|uniref:Prolyl 4-hydroxylase alpha subunit Fe(2+) 2OG dioxygenase domain-containing protein n=1 Tax=Fusarium piperis TaxID=1435070 RepID=A0A9W8TCS4_9HYPO|nr:hypothetical protein N0V84_011756 [Fusarium piperis]
MSTESPSQWNDGFTGAPLSRQSLFDMLEGTVPFIKEAQFIPLHVAEKLEQALSPQLTKYLHATGPPLLKVGVAQFEYQAQAEADLEGRPSDAKQRYFLEAQKHQGLHSKLAELCGQNIWKTVIDRIQSLLPDWDVVVAEEGPGKQYFSGIFRAINQSTPIHCDWSPYDSRTEDWIINKVTQQGVFNLYLTPVTGGQTEVYDVQWTPEVLKYRDPESYGYWPKLVEGRGKVAIQPQVCDLCFFSSRNMHKVFPVEREAGAKANTHPHTADPVDGTRARLTLSSFFGTLPPMNPGEKPKLILWS